MLARTPHLGAELVAVWRSNPTSAINAMRPDVPFILRLFIRDFAMKVHNDDPCFWRSSGAATLLVGVLVGAFFLYTEDRARLFGLLPFLLAVAAPLMHEVMHSRYRRRSRLDPYPSEDDR